MATFAVVFTVIFNRRIIFPSWICLFLVSPWMRCIHLAITPSLGSYNLLVLFSVWSFSNKSKSQVKFIWTNVRMVCRDVESPDPPFPPTEASHILVKQRWKCSFTCQQKDSSVKGQSRQPPPEALVNMIHSDPLLQLGRLGRSSQKSVKQGQLTAVKDLAKGTNRMEKGCEWSRG